VVKAKGSFHATAMRYDADVRVRDLNVHHFMAHDSVYTVSADITAKGQGTDFFSLRTSLVADAKIHHVGYGKLNIDNISAHALVSDGKAHANLVSSNPLLKGAVNFDALLSTTRFDGTLSTDFQELDLYEMGVTPDPLTIGMCGHFDINSDLKLTHQVTGIVNDLTISDSSHIYRPSDVDLLLKTTPDTTFVRTQSGDFVVKLDASGRLQIPKDLMESGGLVKEVVVEALADKMEIWDKERHKKAMSTIDKKKVIDILNSIM
jgi:hypothetical protein